jgi:hypothetical protein
MPKITGIGPVRERGPTARELREFGLTAHGKETCPHCGSKNLVVEDGNTGCADCKRLPGARYGSCAHCLDLKEKKPKHFVSACCGSHRCSVCREAATHKLEETIFDDDPAQMRHPLTAYVCCEHFRMIVGMCEFPGQRDVSPPAGRGDASK